MKFVTYEGPDGRALAGVLIEGDMRILSLGANGRGGDADLGSVQAVIEGGESSLERVRRIVARAEQADSLPYDSVRLFAPLPRPVQIRDVLCFLDHMRGAQLLTDSVTTRRKNTPSRQRKSWLIGRNCLR